MKSPVDASGDPRTRELPHCAWASTCRRGSTPRGVGLGEGDGDGDVDGGGCVTNVIVFGALRSWPDAVLAPGPIVTWYWVLGARPLLAGRTASVLASHE